MSQSLAHALLPEFDHEMANTRKTLERVPEHVPDFRPHEKSMTLARLAGHVAETPLWGTLALSRKEFDLAPRDLPEGAPRLLGDVMTTRATLLEGFDAKVAEARALLVPATDATLMEFWTLKKAGHTVLSLPRVAVLRTFLLNHIIHHRAQLGVYLRLNDVAVPSLYGPSADEM